MATVVLAGRLFKYANSGYDVDNNVEVYVFYHNIFDANAQNFIDNARLGYNNFINFLNSKCIAHAKNSPYTYAGVQYNLSITFTDSAPDSYNVIVVSSNPSNPITAYYMSSVVYIGSDTGFGIIKNGGASLPVNPIETDWGRAAGWYSYRTLIQYNGGNIKNINFNGIDITHLNYNGTKIY